MAATALLASLMAAPASARTVVSVGFPNGDGVLRVSAITTASFAVTVAPDTTTSATDDALVRDLAGVSLGPGCGSTTPPAPGTLPTEVRCRGIRSYAVLGSARPDSGDRIELGISAPGAGVFPLNAVSALEGNDVIATSVPARDRILGGPGIDTVSYAGRAPTAGGVIVRAGDPNRLNDGREGSEDMLIDVERVTGTNQADTMDSLTAGTRGNGTQAVLRGLGGNDVLIGGTGEDDLFGGDASDRLSGREEATTVGATSSAGSRAWPSQLTTARVDQLDCGAGFFDTAVMDLRDTQVGCESVQIAAIDEGGILSILNRSLRRRRGRVAVRLHCPRSSKTRCRGRLTISRRGRRLGSARYLVRKGGRRTVRLRAGRAGGTVLVRARERDSKGRPKTTEKRLRLR